MIFDVLAIPSKFAFLLEQKKWLPIVQVLGNTSL